MPQLVDSAIRRSILYFDHIQWPRTPQSMPIASGSEYGVLEEQGYFQRTDIHVPSAGPAGSGDTIGGAHRYGGTRIHKEDARQVKALIEEFRMAAYDLFRDARIQQHGVRDKRVDDLTGTDLSNVVSIMDRKAREADHV